MTLEHTIGSENRVKVKPIACSNRSQKNFYPISPISDDFRGEHRNEAE